MVKAGGIYKHYKTKQNYLVLTVATHSETLEPMVVYVTLYNNDKSAVWVRPQKMWEEQVANENGKLVPRFKLI